jgi:hypothetical protein
MLNMSDISCFVIAVRYPYFLVVNILCINKLLCVCSDLSFLNIISIYTKTGN